MAAEPSNKELEDINSLNKYIEELSSELTGLVNKSNERGIVLNKIDNRRIETLQENINGLKLKRLTLLKKSRQSKAKDKSQKKVHLCKNYSYFTRL